MSDSYNVKGVTITPQPGGYYELTHPNMAEPVRERGKEKADQRAEEIAAAFTNVDDDSHIAPQGELPDAPPVLAKTPDFEPPVVPQTVNDPVLQALLEQNAAMQKQMLAMQEHMAALSAAGIQTVGHTEGDPVPRVKAPASYTGEMDPEVRKALNARGIKTVKIVLEESEHIPPTGLFLGHNGRSYMIQPGTPVEVPEFLVGILNDGVTSAPIVNAESKKVIGYRDRLKYPYRRVE